MSDFENTSLAEEHNRQLIPVLPLRDVVVYPHMVIPLFVGRKRSIEALELATGNDKQILLVAQKEADVTMVVVFVGAKNLGIQLKGIE